VSIARGPEVAKVRSLAELCGLRVSVEKYNAPKGPLQGKRPTLPTSYRPICLLDTFGKLFEKILLSRILCEVNGRGLLCDEEFGFGPKHSTALQLTSLVERVSGNFDEKRLTGAVFLDVAKAFDTLRVDGLL
jgi:hypothetical protein